MLDSRRKNQYFVQMKNTALITGASTGIGREFAWIHAERGGDLVVVARSADKLKSLKEELSGKYGVEVYIITRDLSLQGAAEEVFRELQEHKIEIDYLINNAGFGGLGEFLKRDWNDDKSMIDLNVMALTELTRFIAPRMVERKKGKILNVSSTASLMPGPLQAVYFASKAYVTSFGNALSEELRGTGVTVTTLLPGATESEFGRVSGMDKTPLFNKTASARSVAEAGYKAMLSGKLNVLAGLPAGGKIMFALIPFIGRKTVLKMVRKMQEV